MGWDACTTDSNHSIDQGVAGLVRTATLLEKAGVRHVGTFRSPAERRKPVILTTDEGVKVGIVGGTYSLNGFTLPPDQRWAVSMWDADNLIAQARAAKAAGRRHRAGAVPRRRRVLPAPQRPAGRAGTPPHREPGGRPGVRRARPRRPADHPGQREVGGLRHGQHGRPERHRRTHAPTRASASGSRSARHGARLPGDPRGVHPDVRGTTTPPAIRSASGRSTRPSRQGVGDRARLLEARRMTRLAVDGLDTTRRHDSRTSRSAERSDLGFHRPRGRGGRRALRRRGTSSRERPSFA